MCTFGTSVHSYSLTGTLNEESSMKYTFVNNESVGLWQICVRDISLTSYENSSEFVHISVNIVKDKKYIKGSITTYQPSIASFFLQSKKVTRQNIAKSFHTFDLLWFQCNFPSEYLQVFFLNETNQKLNVGTTYQITFLMQRIQ